jgi:hypothetical protein
MMMGVMRTAAKGIGSVYKFFYPPPLESESDEQSVTQPPGDVVPKGEMPEIKGNEQHHETHNVPFPTPYS